MALPDPAPAAPDAEEVLIETPNGAPSDPARAAGAVLHGRLFQPGGAAPGEAVVLHPATGVPRDYYAAFAAWLAETQGAAVLIYAYRGCESAQDPAALRRSRVGMIDWGLHDQQAAMDWLRARFPGLGLRVIGHSLGGFMASLHTGIDAATRLTAVCAGPAYWKRARGAARRRAFAFWHGMGQAGVAFHGYLPGRLLGLGMDMPAGVYRDWRRWCTNRDLHMPDWGGALPRPAEPPFTGRLTLVSAADDDTIPTPVVEDLARFHPAAASVETRVMDPAAFGLRAIGHIGAFHPRSRAVWPMLAG